MAEQMTLPIGQQEGPRLELKSKAALEKPASIVREVAAMLNAGGGEIWVGIGERDEVATELEAISDPEKEKRRLQDAFVDLLEPVPSSGEVKIDVVNGVLRIAVEAGSKKPYAHLHRSIYRAFPIRVGSRVRAMSRSELAAAFEELGSAEDELRTVVDEAWSEQVEDGDSRLWVFFALQPHAVEIDFDEYVERFGALISSPAESDNRRMGFNFCSELERPISRPGRLRAGGPTSYTWTELRRNGTLEFRAPLERLERVERELFPFALVEYPTSALRIARTFLDDHRDQIRGETRCVVDLGLLGLNGRTLRPGIPGSINYQIEKAEPADFSDLRVGPRLTSVEELLHQGDELAWSLLRRVYEAFGWLQKSMPTILFDETTRTVTMPR